MGTRNLTCVMKDGQYKVAQYGQWDGYPEGQGMTILKYLRGMDDISKVMFSKHLDSTSWISDEEYRQLWKDLGISSKNGFVALDEGQRFEAKYPHLYRNMGGEILQHIEKYSNLKLQNEIDFAQDSLFCEWAYVVDLDKNTFEVYQGFNEEQLTIKDRFYREEKLEDLEENGGYHAVKLLISFDLDDLPTPKEFLEQIDALILEDEEE